jgi:hypothetical protein
MGTAIQMIIGDIIVHGTTVQLDVSGHGRKNPETAISLIFSLMIQSCSALEHSHSIRRVAWSWRATQHGDQRRFR